MDQTYPMNVSHEIILVPRIAPVCVASRQGLSHLRLPSGSSQPDAKLGQRMTTYRRIYHVVTVIIRIEAQIVLVPKTIERGD